MWKQIPESNELVYEISNMKNFLIILKKLIDSLKNNYKDEQSLKEVLKKNNIFFLASRINDQKQSKYFKKIKFLKKKS